jgi:histidinol-phosphate phosphatase family protein
VKQAVIVAGGMGTRLRARLGDLPKPMIPIAGKPLLEHLVELARRHDFTDIFILACYRADLIEQHFGDGRRFGVKITTVVEREPLGTAGAVLAARDQLAESFVVLYGDTMVNVDLDRLWRCHRTSRAEATLLLHPNDHPQDSDLVETDAQDWVVRFHNRPHAPDRWYQNLVNAGLYVLNRDSLRIENAAPPLDFGKDIFPALLRRGAHLLAYNSPEYIKDIGTPERYDRVCAEFQSGVIARSSLQTPQRAVFLDRDGTLVPDRDCLRSAEGLELLPGVAEAVHRFNHDGWRVIVVTNQPVIAKGWCSEAELQRIHNKLETLLGRQHAFLDRIYFCPHHPDAGFEGERKELKIRCDCRKPATGMIRRAAADLNLDLAQCWLIGDTTTDVQTARNAGVRSILVRTGSAGADAKFAATPDFTCDTLNAAADLILGRNT